LSAEARQAAKEAIQALQALQSVTRAGVTTSAWRVKILGKVGPLHELYDLAEQIARDPAPQLCAEIQPLIGGSPAEGTRRSPEAEKGIETSFNLEVLWSCASKRIAQAEEAMSAR
jgi:hypothetical protein